MIEDPPQLVVRRSFERPSRELLTAFAEAPTGWLVDAQDGRAALDATIKPVIKDDPAQVRFCGAALTCWCGPNDNLALMAALHFAQPGDVLVAATENFARAGIAGDMLLGMAKNQGVVALVTDGLVRDTAGLRTVGLPVFSAGVTPDSCVRSGPGTIGLPVVVGGRAIAPGDIVVGDADGVATVPLASAALVQERLRAVAAAEAALAARIEGGLGCPDAVVELLNSERVRYLD